MRNGSAKWVSLVCFSLNEERRGEYIGNVRGRAQSQRDSQPASQRGGGGERRWGRTMTEARKREAESREQRARERGSVCAPTQAESESVGGAKSVNDWWKAWETTHFETDLIPF